MIFEVDFSLNNRNFKANFGKVIEVGGDTETAYNSGYADGEQAGQKAEYDKFWDTFQNNGGTQNYYYAFAHDRYSDKNYNPKYPIKCSSGTADARYIFYTSPITDTKVEIVANNKDLNYCFHNSEIVTIRKITVVAATGYTNTFYNCQDLKNITFGGTIGQDISFANSKYLTAESIQNIIDHLATVTSAKTLTFHATVAGKLTEEQLLQIANKNWQVG